MTVTSTSTSSSSSKDDTKQAIATALRKVGLVAKVEPSILSQCVALSKTMHVSPAQIAECWDVVSLDSNFKTLNEHSWTALRNEVLKLSEVIPPPEMTLSSGVQIKRKAYVSSPTQSKQPKTQHSIVTPSSKQTTVTTSTSSSSAAATGSSGRRISLSPKPPSFLQTESARKKAKYEARQGAGTVVSEYKNSTPVASTSAVVASLSKPKCRIAWQDLTSNLAKPYRHMFTTVEEKAETLEAHLNEMSEIFQSRYNFGQGDLAALEAVGLPRQEMVCCLGRICNSAHEGRMNATTVMLEGSRATSGGHRIEVDLSHLKSDYSLFPGQIVAIEGYNTTGRRLVAERLCEGAPLPAHETKAADLLRFHSNLQDGAPLKIVSAAGPFTTSDNLDYQPLLDLLQMLLTEHQDAPPDVVILTGPFVDMRHPAVASGQTIVEDSFVPLEVLFAHKVSQVLEDFYEKATHATQFILQPSLDDATSEWVFPQAPLQDSLPKAKGSDLPGGEEFELGTLGLSYVENINREGDDGAAAYRRVHCVPNPCTLRINEVVVGLTSTDILLHTSTSETNGHLPPGSRLARIARHLLQQRSYYPLFPAPVNLNWHQREHWKMTCRPDILLCPSKLTPFAKAILDSTLVVNPGPLTRDSTGGTYAVMNIHPLPREILDSTDPNVSLQHNVAQRTGVEVKRI